MASTKSCRLVACVLTAAVLSCSGVSADEAERTEDITAQIVSLQKRLGNADGPFCVSSLYCISA